MTGEQFSIIIQKEMFISIIMPANVTNFCDDL